MRSYEIRLTTPGFEKAVAQLNSIGAPLRRTESLFSKLVSSATGIDGVTRRVNKLADALERAASASATAAATVQTAQGTTGAGTVRGAPGRSRQFATGPNQQLAEAMQQLEAAKAAGNPLAVRDAARSIRLKERAISLDDRRKGDPEHLTRPGLLELFSDLNNLMRGFKNGNFGSTINTLASLSQNAKNQGGGINMQQLLGQGGLIGGKPGGASGGAMGSAMAARAVGLAVNPVTIGAAAAVASITAMAVAAKAAAGALTAVRASASAAGASPGEVAALRAMGIDPGAVPGLGASLRSKLSSDPFAMAIGGYAAPSHLTGESDAKLVRQQLDRLRGLHDEGKALDMVRVARILGITSLLDEARVSKKMWAAMKDDAKVAERIFGDTGKTDEAREYDAALKRIGGQWENLKAVFGGSYVQKFADTMSSVADAMKLATQAGEGLKPVLDLLAAFQIGGTGGGIIEAIKLALGGGGKGKSANSPIDRNTAAMEKLAAVLQDVVGGGARARGALSPSQRAAAQRGDQLNAARDLRAFRL